MIIHRRTASESLNGADALCSTPIPLEHPPQHLTTNIPAVASRSALVVGSPLTTSRSLMSVLAKVRAVTPAPTVSLLHHPHLPLAKRVASDSSYPVRMRSSSVRLFGSMLKAEVRRSRRRRYASLHWPMTESHPDFCSTACLSSAASLERGSTSVCKQKQTSEDRLYALN